MISSHTDFGRLVVNVSLLNANDFCFDSSYRVRGCLDNVALATLLLKSAKNCFCAVMTNRWTSYTRSNSNTLVLSVHPKYKSMGSSHGGSYLPHSGSHTSTAATYRVLIPRLYLRLPQPFTFVTPFLGFLVYQYLMNDLSNS